MQDRCTPTLGFIIGVVIGVSHLTQHPIQATLDGNVLWPDKRQYKFATSFAGEYASLSGSERALPAQRYACTSYQKYRQEFLLSVLTHARNGIGSTAQSVA